nr:early light-induced protein 2, chloroplastic-like [Tanacetum cinerariifolium]
MNLVTSSQPPQQRLRDTPPHSLTQVSHFESSPVTKGKQGKGNKTPTKENHHHTYRWTQKEEKLLAETEHAWLSGENDSTWLARCYKTFSENYLYVFTHYEAWDVLKNHDKWHGVKAIVPKIHVRTTEDIEELNELFQGVRAESKSNGLMTSDAELWNGRFAMLGLVSLALTEFVQGTPLV